ncbi:MAG: hypothetical protein MAG794_01575 [Gammaproteobacteria bacterium]|nr:hypothetical protein [Gammaproteobacteria bacterium]
MKQCIAACLGLILYATCASSWAADFRIYRVNDIMHQDRILALNEDEPGCHNLLLRVTVHRVAQIGFEYCTVYAEKDCAAGSEIPVTWKHKKAPVAQFTQGARWFLVSDDPQGKKMGSWHCKAR